MDNDDGPDQRRDALLHQLLKTPPQPRPKRERDQGKRKPTSGGVESVRQRPDQDTHHGQRQRGLDAD